MCGRSEQEAWDATGYGVEAHHAVPQQVLRRIGFEAYLWDSRNAVCLCVEPCHRRHTSRLARVPFERLPGRVLEFAGELGLTDALLREHPAVAA